jgi:acyl carrier protein
MTPQEIELKVREITAKILKRNIDEVKPTSRYREDLGADSLGIVELLYEFEQAFDVAIPDDKAKNIATVGDAVRALQETKGK